MGIILKPNLFVEDIKLSVNDNDEYGAEKIIDYWGPTMPVIKINDYVLSPGEITDFNLKIGYNSLPTFSITVKDYNYNVRKTLKKVVVDKSIIFIGFKDWYLKFNGIILSIPSDVGDEEIYLSGMFFNEKLYESIQKSYNNKKVSDICEDICKLTNMGLFTYSNNSLTNSIENCINPNKKHIEFFNYIIQKYTDNIWSVDTYGFFHVSNIETLRKQPFDKFKFFEGKKLDVEKDIIITTNHWEENKQEKFVTEFYTIKSNIGLTHINNNKKYSVSSTVSEKILKNNEELGIGDNTENTFSRFSKSFFPYYSDIINKDIGGKTITVSMQNMIYELTPFSIVNLELYLPKDKKESTQKLDIENSGKKIVIGFEYIFESNNNKKQSPPIIKQIIDLI